MRRFQFATLAVLFWLAALPAAYSQSVAGSVTGTVTDPAGAVIAGAPVQLVNDVSKQTRKAATNKTGSFKFASVPPGTYTLHIVQPGFKTYEQTNVIVGTQEDLDLHNIALSIGAVSTSISVEAQAAHVQTANSNHSFEVDQKQIQNTPLPGRDFHGLIKTLAGVQDLNPPAERGWGAGLPTINGGQQGQVLLTLGGVPAQDSGAPGGDAAYQNPSVAAINEVTLLVGNYNAQYGSRNGGQVNVTIKSGTSQFHGDAYYYLRNKALNANEFFNNSLDIAKPRYHFNNPGFTVGGPVPTWVIPGVSFNKNRNRLFFFWSYDYVFNNSTSATNHYTMPTALERQGDFSRSFNTDGSPIIIRNPATGLPFAGDKIPSTELSPIGTAMLNLFPLPNTTDPTGQRQYNYQFTPQASHPRSDKILRIDYNISQKNTMFVRLMQDYQADSGYGAILGALGDGWGQFPHSYHIPSVGMAANWIHIFSPNLVNNLTWGINKAHQENTPTNEDLYKDSLLPLTSNGQALNLPTIFGAGVNTMNLEPNVRFGLPSGFSAQSAPAGIPNLPAFGFDSRWPFDGTDSLQDVNENLTWVKGNHTFMAGFYFEHDARNVSVYSTYSTEGTYYFGSDLGNPVDTGDPFSNAAFGSVYGYGQDNVKQINRARYQQYEWFLQDTWKVTPHFTLDYGMRFQWLGPLYSSGDTLGIFDTSDYNSATVGQLLYPYCTVSAGAGASCPSADKKSINPTSGATYPYVLQGTFDPATYPAGSVPFSGISSHLTNLWNAPPIQYNPRIGFAWDVFGNGNTAIRGGFGIFHGRYAGVDTIGASGVGVGPMAAPPHFQAPIILNQTIADLGSSPLVFTPQDVNGGGLNYKPPETYDWSFEIEHNLGKGTVLSASYIGNVAHHQWDQTHMDFNAVAPLTTWTPNG
ncbi:MAG: carboxypeptidase regulatory-like domain-containing protein, partial [Terriglobia bacterium]